jgi:SAM-dependent methyltransferase
MTTASRPDIFDSAAASYDALFESLPGTPRLRRIVQNRMLRTFHPGDHILELNAGTGTDAISLASHGIHVHATDGSAAMVRTIAAKAAAAGVEHYVSTGILPLDETGRLQAGPFDGVLSNLGGLNCLPDLSPVLQDLAHLIRPGGHALLCFMPDFSLWETAAFALRGDWKRARRRRNPEGCLAEIQGAQVRTFYHSPAALVRSAAAAFTVRAIIGLNIITPPPSSSMAHTRLHAVLPLLEQLEDMLASLPPLNRLGDHVLIILQRRT